MVEGVSARGHRKRSGAVKGEGGGRRGGSSRRRSDAGRTKSQTEETVGADRSDVVSEKDWRRTIGVGDVDEDAGKAIVDSRKRGEPERDWNVVSEESGSMSKKRLSSSARVGLRFECASCRKRFKYKYCVRNHMRVHTGERAFVCTFPGCNMKFKWRSSLNSHVFAHQQRSNAKDRDQDTPNNDPPRRWYSTASETRNDAAVHVRSSGLDPAQGLPTLEDCNGGGRRTHVGRIETVTLPSKSAGGKADGLPAGKFAPSRRAPSLQPFRPETKRNARQRPPAASSDERPLAPLQVPPTQQAAREVGTRGVPPYGGRNEAATPANLLLLASTSNGGEGLGERESHLLAPMEPDPCLWDERARAKLNLDPSHAALFRRLPSYSTESTDTGGLDRGGHPHGRPPVGGGAIPAAATIKSSLSHLVQTSSHPTPMDISRIETTPHRAKKEAELLPEESAVLRPLQRFKSGSHGLPSLLSRGGQSSASTAWTTSPVTTTMDPGLSSRRGGDELADVLAPFPADRFHHPPKLWRRGPADRSTAGFPSLPKLSAPRNS